MRRPGGPRAPPGTAGLRGDDMFILPGAMDTGRRPAGGHPPAQAASPSATRRDHNSEHQARWPVAPPTFQAYPDALSNTRRIAEQCNFQTPVMTGNMVPCAFPPPPGLDTGGYCVSSALAVLPHFYPSASDWVCRQLAYELQVIANAGLSNDFLLRSGTSYTFARERGIRCQGRGSAANSLVAYRRPRVSWRHCRVPGSGCRVRARSVRCPRRSGSSCSAQRSRSPAAHRPAADRPDQMRCGKSAAAPPGRAGADTRRCPAPAGVETRADPAVHNRAERYTAQRCAACCSARRDTPGTVAAAGHRA